MILYWLFRLGYFIANALPLKIAYAFAGAVATLHYYLSPLDRESVKKNLRHILGDNISKEELSLKARTVFINFAKYLVDFFRFASVDEEYVKKFVKVDGLEHLDKALSYGKGAIMLSAHIGNWELGGQALSLLRQPLMAVVLTHRNKKINDFFTRQRSVANMKPVEIGLSLRKCYELLKKNGMLAVLGDRDFSKNGFIMPFFGKDTLIPKGPAVFSRRLGASIVPCFMIRQEDDTFRLVMDPPILPDMHEEEDAAIKKLTQRCTATIESYVKRYPTQWYIFREMWNGK